MQKADDLKGLNFFLDNNLLLPSSLRYQYTNEGLQVALVTNALQIFPFRQTWWNLRLLNVSTDVGYSPPVTFSSFSQAAIRNRPTPTATPKRRIAWCLIWKIVYREEADSSGER